MDADNLESGSESDATEFRFEMDLDDCKAYEAVKAYVRAGNGLNVFSHDMHNTFVRHLADELIPLPDRIGRHRRLVQAAIHNHVRPETYTLGRFIPAAIPYIEVVVQHLHLIDMHCLRLLTQERADDIHVEVNVDIDPEHVTHVENADGQATATQNVGAAGVPVIAACNHYTH